MRSFKIGLDILADVPGQSGQVNIHRNMLLWLPRLAPEWTFCAFATPRLRTYYKQYGIGAPNLQWIMCWADNTDGTLRRLITQELQLLWLARRAQIDCLLTNPLPFWSPCTKICTIYRHTLNHAAWAGMTGWYRRLRIRYSAVVCDAIFGNSQYALTELQRLVGFTLKRRSVIWEAFDARIFSKTPLISSGAIRPEIATIANSPGVYILVPGGLQSHKNPVVVFEMLAYLQEAHHVLPRIIFVGNNSRAYATSLREKYAAYFADGTVMATGFCSHEELAYLGRNATLAIYSSKVETFGVPPLEMMALGIPTLVSNAGPLPEISGPGAELFDPDDAADLARRVAALLGSPSAREALSHRGTEFVQRYSWERNARETLEFIQSVLEQKYSARMP